MRQIPVDAFRLTLIATGKIAAKPEYARLPDGTSKLVQGSQATDDAGCLLWTVDCLVDDGTPDEENGRAEVIGVTVAAKHRPVLAKFTPVNFVGLTASVMKDKATGWPRVTLRASGIAKDAPAAKAA